MSDLTDLLRVKLRRRFGHPAKHWRSPARCPSMADFPAPLRTRANCGGPHNEFHRSCPAYNFKSEVAVLRNNLGLTLRGGRQEARRRGFPIRPFSNTIHRSILPSTQTISTSTKPPPPYSSPSHPYPHPFSIQILQYPQLPPNVCSSSSYTSHQTS